MVWRLSIIDEVAFVLKGRILKYPWFLLEMLQFLRYWKEEASHLKCICFAFRSPHRIFQPPSWQRVSDFIYVYSAFCSRTPDSNDICPAVTILAIATQESLGSNDLQKMTCQLWYSNDRSGPCCKNHKKSISPKQVRQLHPAGLSTGDRGRDDQRRG